MPFVSGGDTAVETLTLDPTSEDASNSPVELISATINLIEHSYPAPPSEVQYAGSVDTEGMIPGSRKDGNRTISLTVECWDHNSLVELQAKVAKISREGGTLKRVLSTGQTVVYDLWVREGYEPTFDQLYHFGGVTVVQLTFPAKPFGRGASVTLSQHTVASLPALEFTETGIAGDITSTGELAILEGVGGGLWWGLQSRHYSSASTADLFIPAESTLWVMDEASLAAGTAGASGSGSNVARNTALTTNVDFGRQFYATTMTHIGAFRVLARAYAPAANTGTVEVLFAYSAPQVNAIQTANAAVTVPEGAWTWIDLGQATVEEAVSGTHAWGPELRARSTVAGDDLEIDCLAFIPIDECWGKVTAGDHHSGDAYISSEQALTTNTFTSQLTRVARYEGDYLRVPPAGLEERTVRFIIVPIATTIADVTAQLTYCARYLTVPDA